MNKTQLFLQLPESNVENIRYSDTFLAPSTFGTVLGLEFPIDVSNEIQVGDIIFLDKDNKSINPWIDGQSSVLGITFSSIFPAPASLVFTDRPLQLPITFTSSEAGTLYKGSQIQSTWTEVDLSDNVAFPITFNIADVRQINNRNGAYSKTLQIPGTKTNNDVFKYIFDIQGIDNYDTRIKVKCSLVIDTIPVLEGYIQLDSITCTDNKYWVYNCIIFGENANFSKEIDQNARLEDLDFSDLNHDFNIDSITQSWIEDWNYGYYYPLIDYNSGQNPNDTSLGISSVNFRGSIYMKQYWDRIFKQYGYTYQSDFLNSDAFKNLIYTPSKKIIENDPDWRFNSTFRAGLTQSVSFSTLYGYEYTTLPDPNSAVVIIGYPIINNPLTTNMQNLLQLNDTISPNGDPGSNFIQVPAGNFYYKNVFQGNYTKAQKIVLNLDIDLSATLWDGNSITNNRLNGIRLLCFCDIFKNGTLIAKKPVFNYGNTTINYTIHDFFVQLNLTGQYGAPEEWDVSLLTRKQFQIVLDSSEIDGGLAPNDEIYFRLGIITTRSLTDASQPLNVLRDTQQFNWLNTKFNLTFSATTNGLDGTYFFNEIDTSLSDNQPYRAIEMVPRNIKQIDFINSVINMFNLYLYQDPNNPKNIFIEPRDRFYETTQFLDWSDKLDISKEIQQVPIVEKYKRILMTYKRDNDFYNTLYFNTTNEVYGQFEYLTGNEFSTSEKKIELIFSSSPLNMYSINDLIYDNTLTYTRIYSNEQPITDEKKFKVDNTGRVLYRKTLSTESNGLNIYTFRTGLNENTVPKYRFNVYPYAGHLDDPTDASLDLCFEEPKILFYKNDFPYTANNLYNEYYRQFFEEIYGPESKMITAYVYLNSQDILDFDYRKLIYIDNISSGSPGYFRVNKIEYDPFNKESYKVELIKVLNNFKSQYRKIINIGDVGVALPGTGNSLITSGDNVNQGNSNILGGINSSLVGNNNLITGQFNEVRNGDNNLLNGSCNVVTGRNNGILGGKLNRVGSMESSIISGASNSVYGDRGIIVGGYGNEIKSYASNSLILSGYGNRIGATSSTQSTGVLNSFIIGGRDNTILTGTTTSNTDNSFIIGGFGNTIAAGLTNSLILNGQNFTATQSNTIYLEGNVLINGNTPATVTPIPTGEIAFGDGTGITSNSNFNISSSFNLNLGSTNTITGSPVINTSFLNTDNSSISSLSSNRSALVATSGSQLSGTLVQQSAIIGGINNNVSQSNSVIVAGNGLTLNEANTLMTSNLRVNGVIRLANSSGTISINPGSSVTINNSLVTVNSRIFISAMTQIGVGDTFYVTNIVPGTSFDIVHTNPGGFNAIVAWLIINQ